MSLLFTTLEKLSNKENPKKNINRPPWEGVKDKISLQTWLHGVWMKKGEWGGELEGTE